MQAMRTRAAQCGHLGTWVNLRKVEPPQSNKANKIELHKRGMIAEASVHRRKLQFRSPLTGMPPHTPGTVCFSLGACGHKCKATRASGHVQVDTCQ